MKFLVLTQYFAPEVGAPQTRLRAFTAELLRLGHEVEVVTTMPNYPRGFISPEYRGSFYRREGREGVLVHRVWVYAAVGGGIRRMLNYLSFTLLSVFALARAQRPDYVFVESPPLILSLPGWLFARIWGARLILNVADLSPKTEVALGVLKSGWLAKLMFALERWSYRRADCINAITEGVRTYLLTERAVPEEKILFLPNGVDTVFFHPGPEDCNLKRELGLEGKRIVLYPGTHGYAHALDIVLGAAKLLEDRPDIHFLLLGDGSDKARLERLCRDMDLGNLTFHDPVPLDELGSYFSIADCGLASLRGLAVYEGARPAKVFPILAAGKALIFAGRGEAAELVERARAGIVVPPNDPQPLARAITLLIANPELRASLGMNGRRFVETNFQWSKLIGDWIHRLCETNPQREAAAPVRL